MGAQENKLQKAQFAQNEILRMLIFNLCFLNSCEIWNLFSRAYIRIFSLQLYYITYYIYSLKKRMRYGLKYSGTISSPFNHWFAWFYFSVRRASLRKRDDCSWSKVSSLSFVLLQTCALLREERKGRRIAGYPVPFRAFFCFFLTRMHLAYVASWILVPGVLSWWRSRHSKRRAKPQGKLIQHSHANPASYTG